MKRLVIVLSVALITMSGCKASYYSDGKGPIISIDPDFKEQAGVELVYEEQSVDPNLRFMKTITSLACETDRDEVASMSIETLINQSDYEARRDLRVKAGRADADVLKYISCNGQPRGDRTGCTQCIGSLYSKTKNQG
ncbi:hypothetical protein [uncultured Umboniibacter sp.]|uniref:hypothetical protein n=1 Tax=uncultured Umboniibacter sp. TaxID=1798917 RepID=UPI002626CDA8|nr:hypothetical protein [uncultured Umboniibacter sp.]